MPGGPIRFSSRAPPSSSPQIAVISSMRPISAVGGTGRAGAGLAVALVATLVAGGWADSWGARAMRTNSSCSLSAICKVRARVTAISREGRNTPDSILRTVEMA